MSLSSASAFEWRLHFSLAASSQQPATKHLCPVWDLKGNHFSRALVDFVRSTLWSESCFPSQSFFPPSFHRCQIESQSKIFPCPILLHLPLIFQRHSPKQYHFVLLLHLSICFLQASADALNPVASVWSPNPTVASCLSHLFFCEACPLILCDVMQDPMFVSQTFSKPLDSGSGWDFMGGKDKPITRICIYSKWIVALSTVEGS